MGGSHPSQTSVNSSAAIVGVDQHLEYLERCGFGLLTEPGRPLTRSSVDAPFRMSEVLGGDVPAQILNLRCFNPNQYGERPRHVFADGISRAN